MSAIIRPVHQIPIILCTQLTVASETLEGVFLLNNSMNIHQRPLKPSAIELKTKILLEKVTQVILHFGTDHGLSMSNIY